MSHRHDQAGVWLRSGGWSLGIFWGEVSMSCPVSDPQVHGLILQNPDTGTCGDLIGIGRLAALRVNMYTTRASLL